MNNNNLDQVTMRSSKRKRSRFNLKHVNETSFNIGEIQPLMCKEVIPNSNSVLSVTNVVRLAALNAPCFGEMNLHHNFSFVGMSDLTDKFAALLAKKPVAFSAGVTRIPEMLPHIRLSVLSALIMIGCKITAYFLPNGDNSNSFDASVWSYQWNSAYTPGAPLYGAITGNLSSDNETELRRLFNVTNSGSFITDSSLWCPDLSAKAASEGLWNTAFKDYTGCGINIGRIMGWSRDLWVPSGNFSPWSFLINHIFESPTVPQTITDAKAALQALPGYNAQTMSLEDITPDNADYIFTNSFKRPSAATTSTFMLCIRLSDFGKRLRKVLLSAGYGIDFNSDTEVSLMKLFAIYKSYFDSFGITLYQGWETTPCACCLQHYDSDYLHDFGKLFYAAAPSPLVQAEENARIDFISFISDLTDMWFTEEQDYVTAHIRNAAVGTVTDLPSMFAENGTPNVGDKINITEQVNPNEPTTLLTPQAHAFINNVLHSQLDSEILKRLYKVTNRETIAGRRIAELLKQQGLGEYMKRCRSQFIGHWKCPIDIFDVTSQVDNLDVATGQGKALGEYVGKGVGEGKSKRMKYAASEFGFIIDLAAVVPESGWLNGADLSVHDIKKLDFYNPEYDGLGFEMSPKKIVTDDNTYGSVTSPDHLDEGFGFVPTYTRHKVAHNVCSGDFSLRSTRSGYLTFSMNKFVDVGGVVSRSKQPLTDANKSGIITVNKSLTPSRLPIASPMYRYLGRYPWMGQLMRIFQYLGRDVLVNQFDSYQGFDHLDGESVNTWYVLNTGDNLIVHNVYLYDYYAPMLPIEDSFETHDEGNNGVTDMAIGKA